MIMNDHSKISSTCQVDWFEPLIIKSVARHHSGLIYYGSSMGDAVFYVTDDAGVMSMGMEEDNHSSGFRRQCNRLVSAQHVFKEAPYLETGAKICV